MYVDVIAPQLFMTALPSATTFGIVLLKDTAVASTIGVSELAAAAHHMSQETFKGIEVYTVVCILYLAISLSMATASRNLDRRLRAKVGC